MCFFEFFPIFPWLRKKTKKPDGKIERKTFFFSKPSKHYLQGPGPKPRGSSLTSLAVKCFLWWPTFVLILRVTLISRPLNFEIPEFLFLDIQKFLARFARNEMPFWMTELCVNPPSRSHIETIKFSCISDRRSESFSLALLLQIGHYTW